MKIALIAGGTGLIGNQLIKLLLASNLYQKVISVGRRRLEITNNKLIQQVVNFDDLDIDIEHIDDVFCCLGTTMKLAGTKEKFRQVDFQYPVALANWSFNHGAKHFLLVSSMGADALSNIFYNQVKGEVEQAVSRMGFSRVDIFRPSLLLGPRKDTRLAESLGKVLMLALSFIFIGPLKNYKAIESRKVAVAMISLADEGRPGNYIHLSSVLQKY